jgi:class 3 adenylate cyclase
MSDGTEQRKLAAIMFTDMVGYSALAQSNDKLALELLAECQRLLRTPFGANVHAVRLDPARRPAP